MIVKIMPNAPATPTGPLVAVIVFDELCTFEYGIAVEVFGLPRPEFGADWYRFVTVAAEQGLLRATGGLVVQAGAGLERLAEASLVIVPGWKDPAIPPPPELVAALRAAHARGARLMSICSGVFVLAATGLLDGKRVTTHWRHAEALRRHWPRLRFDPDVLYVDEGQILTSAGSAAGLDLALHLVRHDYGPEIANTVARRLVLPAHRNGGQRQYIERPVPQRADARLSDVLQEMRTRLDHPFTVPELARLAAMSERSFIRRFIDTTGETPAAWLTGIRLDRARELLEADRLPIDEVARLSGFGSTPSLRHHFRRTLGTSPTAYRARFGQAHSYRPGVP